MADERGAGGQKPPDAAGRQSVSGRSSVSGIGADRPRSTSAAGQGVTSRGSRASTAGTSQGASVVKSRQSVSGRPRSSSTVRGVRNKEEMPSPGELGTVASRQEEDRGRESMSKRISVSAKRQRGVVVCEGQLAEDIQGLNCVGFCRDGIMMACGFGNGSIQIRRVENAALRQTVRSGLGQRVPMMYVRFHPQKIARFFMASSCGRIYSGSVSSGDYAVFANEESNEVNAVDVSCSGERLVSGGRDGRVRVYDVANAKLLHVYEIRQVEVTTDINKRAHSDRVFAVRCCRRRENVVVTGGWDDNIKVWDIREPKFCVGTMNGPHVCGDSVDLEDDLIVTGSWTVDNSLQTWDLRQMKRIETIQPINRKRSNKGDFLYVTKFLDGDLTRDLVFVGGSGLSEVELISLKKKEVICSWAAGGVVNCADSLKNFVVFGGSSDVIRICQYVT